MMTAAFPGSTECDCFLSLSLSLSLSLVLSPFLSLFMFLNRYLSLSLVMFLSLSLSLSLYVSLAISPSLPMTLTSNFSFLSLTHTLWFIRHYRNFFPRFEVKVEKNCSKKDFFAEVSGNFLGSLESVAVQLHFLMTHFLPLSSDFAST